MRPGAPAGHTAGNVTPLRRAADEFPASPDPRIYHGPVGEMTRLIEPHSEADPVAILVQGLVVFGALVGRCAYYQVEATRHYTNEFVVLIGQSGRGRKGTSLDRVMQVFEGLDPTFEKRQGSGLASGEGLVWKIRDPAESGSVVDKRLLSKESEFASVLKVAKRQDNTLSANVRNAWDGKTLETMTKTNPAVATDPHVSIIGHITRDELIRNVDVSETANGFLNRFVHIAVAASKELPFGGGDIDLSDVRAALADAVAHARRTGRVRFAEDARETWIDFYRRIRTGNAGLLGDVTGRGEAHVCRFALLYALLDGAEEINRAHLDAAIALWRYSWASARWVYGFSLGDPVADELWSALSVRPDGMSRTDIRDWFSRNKRRSDIDRALQLIAEAGLAERSKESAERPGAAEVERWRPRGLNAATINTA